jgi:hypothetical protein
MKAGRISFFLGILLISVVYVVIQYWVIPTYVQQATRSMAANYADYGFAFVTTIYFAYAAIFD